MPRKNATPSPRRAPAAEVDAAERALMRASQDPANIPGIYNYCDRWCERCSFTTRCLSFKMGAARDRGKAEASSTRRSDGENAAFWNDIAVNFALALRLVKREAKKHGIDLDSPAALSEASREERRLKRKAARDASGLHAAAVAYLDAARILLDRLAPELREAEDALNLQLRLGTGAPDSTAAEIRDALEVVQWYLFFIDVKLQRAVSSRCSSRPDLEAGFRAMLTAPPRSRWWRSTARSPLGRACASI